MKIIHLIKTYLFTKYYDSINQFFSQETRFVNDSPSEKPVSGQLYRDKLDAVQKAIVQDQSCLPTIHWIS